MSVLERIDLALATRMVRGVHDDEPLAAAQRVLDGVRRPTSDDVPFAGALLRLRGFVIHDDDVADVFAGRQGRLAAVTQEHRLLCGIKECLRLIRQRATAGRTPDGWFLVELFRALTAELPRFRNNDLRRGPPWDAVLYLDYPPADQLRFLLDTFDEEHCYRDVPAMFQSLHPVRQGLRILWRFARIAPFPDFNTLVAWLGMNAWLQARGLPMLAPANGDQQLMVRLISGPPPTRSPALETRVLAAFGEST